MTPAAGSKIPPPPAPASLPTFGPPDYTQRHYELRELLDEPCTFATYTAAMRSLARINTLTRAHKPVLGFLERSVARKGVGQAPLEVLDIGCAQGDLLRRIHRWARRRSLPVRLTGVDLNPYASRLARILDRQERLAAKTIRWVTADIFSADVEADIVLCNLTAHHLADEQVVALLRLCATARHGFLLTDLRRSERAAKAFAWMARLLRWHPMVAHDGIISFQRAFSLDEWQALVERAGISAKVIDLGMGKIAVEG